MVERKCVEQDAETECWLAQWSVTYWISKVCYFLGEGVFYFSTLEQKVYRAGDKIDKNEMGWACGAYGWGEGGV
jgi:hypothetical protein